MVDSPRALGPVKKNRNIFSVVATLLFVVTIIASGATYGYLKFVESKISEADKQLSEIRSAFESDKIHELLDASARLNSISSLLGGHSVISQILVMLQKFTLKNIQFDNLSYQAVNGKPTITMDAESASYNSMANQRDVFVESGLLTDVVFSGYTLTDRGTVRSKFSATVLPKLVSYKEFISSTYPEQ